MGRWVKIYEKMTEWEWYEDSHMVHLFLHLLIKANWKPGRWRGIPVERGQYVTSINKLSAQTGISERSIRTGLKRFEDGGEVTRKATNRYSVITICNYDEYQGGNAIERQAERQAGDQANGHSNDKQTAPNSRTSEEGRTSEDKTIGGKAGSPPEQPEEKVYRSAKGKKLTGKTLEAFEEFWEMFENKKGKASAADAFLTVYTPDLHNSIIEGARREATARPALIKNGRTPIYPQGWLTGRRWEDEMHGDPTNHIPEDQRGYI